MQDRGGDADGSEDGAAVRQALGDDYLIPLSSPKLKVLTISIVLCRNAFYFQFISTQKQSQPELRAHFHGELLFDCFNQRMIRNPNADQSIRGNMDGEQVVPGARRTG